MLPSPSKRPKEHLENGCHGEVLEPRQPEKHILREPQDDIFQRAPDFISGLLWMTFSGTAMASAIILPVHFWVMLSGGTMRFDTWYFKAYFFVLFFCALYHGLYRLKALLHDLGVLKSKQKS